MREANDFFKGKHQSHGSNFIKPYPIFKEEFPERLHKKFAA